MKMVLGLIGMLMVATVAEAGVMDWVGGVVEGGAWQVLRFAVEAVFGALALFGLSKWAKWKGVAVELQDVLRVGIEARSPKSDGGKTITKEEWDEILAEASQVVKKAVYTAIGGKK